MNIYDVKNLECVALCLGFQQSLAYDWSMLRTLHRHVKVGVA